MSNKSSIFAPAMKKKKATYQTPQSHLMTDIPVWCDFAGLSIAPEVQAIY